MSKVDVAVIGAGLAGLTAARELRRTGRSVVVLEARDRVGGRTDAHRFASGATVEMGGQWVGPMQEAVLELIAELGLATFPTYDSGDSLTLHQGTLSRFGRDDERLGLPEDGISEVARLQSALEELAGGVPLDAPWRVDMDLRLDDRTFDEWVCAETTDDVARAFYRFLCRALFAAEAHEMSLLHVLFYLRSGGGLDTLVATTGGAQELRIEGGSQRISERMAEDLGGAVRLGHRVAAVAQDKSDVTVHFGEGSIHVAHAIVALPPTLAGRLHYAPPLPVRRDALTQQVPMGSVIKVQVAYETPFWRAFGLNGQALDLDDELSLTFDNSPADGSSGVLLGLYEGAHARAVADLPADRRRDLTLQILGRLFGPEARAPLGYVERDWMAEEFTRGCYGGRLGVGVWTAFGSAIREPVGRIHWAGAETSDRWNGYMDGAVRSGRRAAAEVIAAS